MRVGWKSGSVLAASAVAFISAVVWRRDHGVLRFGYNEHRLEPAEYAALAARPEWTARTLVATDGVHLRGLMRRPSTANTPWVLFFTGNDAHPLEVGQRFLEAVCAPGDWGGAVWAYRGFDGSDGTPSPEWLMADAGHEYDDLVAGEHVDPRRLHVVGFSLGTAMATGVAARSASSPVASLSLLSPTTELDMMPSRWSFPQRFETTKYLPALTGPVLVVHGAEDDVLPIEGGRQIAHVLGARATYVEEPNLKHLDVPTSANVIERVRAFIAAH
ncbi:MAG TPA: alpha/beta fold hydrolase [Polyangiaceae bacterium]|jgi:hypothetical protein|nr:alpha/beta fold hydrolase [Polyangiaceae bacterium]